MVDQSRVFRGMPRMEFLIKRR